MTDGESSVTDGNEPTTSRVGAFPLILALACTLVFGAASWWSWRAGTLLDPLVPAHSVSTWDRLTSPLEWNAFQRLPIVTGDVEGTFAVGRHVWAVGASGLVLHSADTGRTWERQDNIAWAPSPGGPPAGIPRAEPFGLARSAYAAEPPPRASSSPSRAKGTPDRKSDSPRVEPAPSTPPPSKTEDAASSNTQELVLPESRVGAPVKRQKGKQSAPPQPRRAESAGPAGNNPSPGDAKSPSPVETKAAAPPGPVNLHAVAFANDLIGIAVGDGVILRTNDGGESWAVVEKLETRILAVAFAGETRALAVGDDGTAVRSDDGGRTWDSVAELDPTSTLRSVACAESGRCIVVGDHGTFVDYAFDGSRVVWTRPIGANLLAATVRDGKDYVAVGDNVIVRYTPGSSAPDVHRLPEAGRLTAVRTLDAVRFSDPQHGIATDGTSGVIVRTSDGGLSWDAQPTTTTPFTSVAILDANVMVGVGTAGTVLRTVDGGVTWTPVVRGDGATREVRFADESHAVAVGTDGTILRSRDGGATWEVTEGKPRRPLGMIAFSGRDRAAAVGPTGATARSVDGGEHWDDSFVDPDTPWSAIAFGDSDHALAVGGRMVLRTADGGRTWSGSSVTYEFLDAVAFGDVQHAVAVGSTILRSTDGGTTWQEARAPSVPGLLESVVFAPTDPRRAIAVGTAGTILLSVDGGDAWKLQKNDRAESLTAAAFADPRRVTAVGHGGTVLLSVDGGETWTTKPSLGTNLWSVDFGDPKHGIAVGEGGAIFTSGDGGETWTPIQYTRYPAPLFLLLTFAAVGFGLAWAVYAWREPPVEQRKASVTDLLGSDRPLRPGDRGGERLRHIAAGISRFIRNRNTQPPLTIAITGEWGTGKSSLMSLLYDELAGRGFQPVWFNAWHHQHGEQLLASLYANIRAQGIPPFFSLEGLDFRYDLLRIRARRSWVRVALMLLAMGFALNYVRCHAESGEFLVGLASLSADKLLEQLKHATAFAGLVGPLIVILQALRAFGVDPKSLLGVVRLDRDRAVSAVPGARFRFASEFRDVTEALKPRPLVIFIDDLDRCSPDNVLEVLETVNFLVSEGECYVLLGLSRPWVEAAVGLGFEQIAAETADPSPSAPETPATGDGTGAPAAIEPREKRSRFARHYLEKLVNIEVPVPPLDDSASNDILTPDAPQPPPWQARALQKAGRFAGQAWLPALVIATVFGGWHLAARAPDIIPTQETRPGVVPAAPPTAGGAGVAVPSVPPQPGKSAPPDERVAIPARFTPGETDALANLRVIVPAVLGMLALVTVVVVLIVRRARVQTDDSKDFREALQIMRPWILVGHPTPRLLKRYVNHVRFIAMRQRTDPEPESLGQRLMRRAQDRLWGTKPPAPVVAESALFLREPQLVALSALHQSRADWQTCPDWLQRCYDKLKRGELREAIIGREIDAKELDRLLEKLGEAISAYNGEFTPYALFVSEENDRAAISALLEIMAGVRVEWRGEQETVKQAVPGADHAG